LTARVTVNRFWQMYFGTGLVKTVEDFGSQGEWPMHPDLLDWLATEFLDSGWDVKRLQKTIVMSGTYRQSSKASSELLQKDPENRTNTRLQALDLLNDVTYVEAARKLAERMLLEGGAAEEDRIRYAYRLLLARSPQPRELKLIRASLEHFRLAFGKDQKGALE